MTVGHITYRVTNINILPTFNQPLNKYLPVCKELGMKWSLRQTQELPLWMVYQERVIKHIIIIISLITSGISDRKEKSSTGTFTKRPNEGSSPPTAHPKEKAFKLRPGSKLPGHRVCPSFLSTYCVPGTTPDTGVRERNCHKDLTVCGG